MKLVLQNEVHKTTYRTEVQPVEMLLTKEQATTARRALCSAKCCAGVVGEMGPNQRVYAEELQASSAIKLVQRIDGAVDVVSIDTSRWEVCKYCERPVPLRWNGHRWVLIIHPMQGPVDGVPGVDYKSTCGGSSSEEWIKKSKAKQAKRQPPLEVHWQLVEDHKQDAEAPTVDAVSGDQPKTQPGALPEEVW